MKRKLLLIALLVFIAISAYSQNDLIPAVPTLYSQQMGAPAKEMNYTSFTLKHKPVSEKWKQRNKKYISHPDAGYIAKEQPPGNVIELFEKRTESTRFYVDADTPSKVFSQGAYGSLHYKINGQWLLIDDRLDQKNAQILEASHQVEPVGFDIAKKKSYIKTTNGTVYFNDWNVYGKNKNETTLISSANWDDYTAGDDGVFIKNIFPGVDAEMQVLRGRVKTNLIVRSWNFSGYENYLFSDGLLAPQRGTFTFVDEANKESGIGEVDFKSNGKLMARIGKAVMYAEADAGNVAYLPYKFENDGLGVLVNPVTVKAFLKAGKVIIDPLVTGPNGVFTPGSILNSYNNVNCSYDFNTGCSYDWTVPVPPFITVTNVLFINHFLTIAPCTRDKMRFKFGFGDDLCGTGIIWFPIGLPPTPGPTGGNLSVTPSYNSCIKAGCVEKNIRIKISILRSCMGPAGCESSCVQGIGPFITTIEGRTVELVSVTATPPSTACPGEAVNLKATANFGIPPYSFQWTPGNLPGDSVIVNPMASGTYGVTVKDACNQTASGNTSVVVPPLPPAPTIAVTASSLNICAGQPVTFKATAANVSNKSFQWKRNGVLIPGETTDTFTSSVLANQDVITAVLSTTDPCATPKTVTSTELKITVNSVAQPTIRIVSDAIANAVCKGKSVLFTAAATNGGTAPVYQWKKNGVNVGANSPQYTDANLVDQDVISCVLTSNAPCPGANNIESNKITIKVNEPIFVTVNEYVCQVNMPYRWNGQTISSGGLAAATFATKSTVTGCDSTVILNLTISPSVVRTRIDSAACGSVSFGGRNYLSSIVLADTVRGRMGCDSVTRTINITVYPLVPMEQVLDLTGCDSLLFDGVVYYDNVKLSETLKNRFGCDSVSRTVNISIESFTVELKSLSENELLYQGEEVTLQTSSDTDHYKVTSWEPTVLFPNQNVLEQRIRTILADSVIKVYAESDHGCKDSASTTLKIVPRPLGNLLPNVFTPNGDAHNDVWVPTRGTAFPVGELFVYNRWGECVYHTEDYTVPWDGKSKGEKVPSGVYAYKLIISKRFKFHGSVTILY